MEGRRSLVHSERGTSSLFLFLIHNIFIFFGIPEDRVTRTEPRFTYFDLVILKSSQDLRTPETVEGPGDFRSARDF